MAGRPIWKTRSEYTERLGISRGHIHRGESIIMTETSSAYTHCTVETLCVTIDCVRAK
jgi:hypothetical protein